MFARAREAGDQGGVAVRSDRVLFSGVAGHSTNRYESPGVALGGPVRLASEVEIAGVFPDCEWGVVPPLGVVYDLPTVMEEKIDRDSILTFEGNTHFEAIRMACRDFECLASPRRLRFAGLAV